MTIVKVDNQKVIEELPKYLIDECLECCWGVSQSERHDEKFIFAVSGVKRRFLDIGFLDSYLPIPARKVNN
jgi:hypothetical protein